MGGKINLGSQAAGQTFDQMFLNNEGHVKFRNSSETIRHKQDKNGQTVIYQHRNNPFSRSLLSKKRLNASLLRRQNGFAETYNSIARGHGDQFAAALFNRVNLKKNEFMTGQAVHRLRQGIDEFRNEMLDERGKLAFDAVGDFNKLKHDHASGSQQERADSLRQGIRKFMKDHVMSSIPGNDFDPSKLSTVSHTPAKLKWKQIENQLDDMDLGELEQFRDQYLQPIANDASLKLETATYNFHNSRKHIDHAVDRVWSPTKANFQKVPQMLREIDELAKPAPKDMKADDVFLRTARRRALLNTFADYERRKNGQTQDRCIRVTLPPWHVTGQTRSEYFTRMAKQANITDLNFDVTKLEPDDIASGAFLNNDIRSLDEEPSQSRRYTESYSNDTDSEIDMELFLELQAEFANDDDDTDIEDDDQTVDNTLPNPDLNSHVE